MSPIQELQMITVLEPNVHIYRTMGNNDDQSNVLKEIFADHAFVEENNIVSINSINWARIAAQSTYYVWAYLQIFRTRLSIGREVDFSIPSGAFGNGMGGLLAKRMGLPIGRILCATNANGKVRVGGEIFILANSNLLPFHQTSSTELSARVTCACWEIMLLFPQVLIHMFASLRKCPPIDHLAEIV